jgi:hypothetical protein
MKPIIDKIRTYFLERERIFDLFLLVIFSLLAVLTLDYPSDSQLFPFIFLFASLLMLLIKLLSPISATLSKIVKVKGMFNQEDLADNPSKDKSEENGNATTIAREIKSFSWVVVFLILIYLFGILYAIPVFLFSFLKTMGNRKTFEALLITIGVTGFIYLLFIKILHIEFYKGLFFT